MDNVEKPEESLSKFQKIMFLVLIPIVFASVLAVVEIGLLKQAGNRSFSAALMNVGKSAASGVNTVSKLVSSKTPAAQNPGGTAQSPADTANSKAQSANTAAAGTANNPQQSSAQANSSSTTPGSGTAAQDPNSATSSAPADMNADFKKKTDEAASQFTKMSPAQASAIIGNMSLKDSAFSMLGMKAQQRSVILAKMEPKKAAEISKTLADFPPDSTADAASVQKQLDRLPSTQRPVDDLVKTYSQMPASSAALLLSELMKADQNKAVSIFAAMDASARSQILAAMSNTKTNPDGIQYATIITQQLLQTK